MSVFTLMDESRAAAAGGASRHQPESSPDEISEPSRFLQLAEGRALLELGWFVQAWPLLARAPRGDGHGVLVLPGFLGTDASTVPLRRFLRRLGYRTAGWQLGRNTGPDEHLELRMIRRLQSLYWRTGTKVSLVGWSLGGVYARELAREKPDLVRQVVTLGSPFACDPRATSVSELYARVSGDDLEAMDPKVFELMRQPPPVPSTSVYSRSDGVAPWQGCLEQETEQTQNVRVPGSHCGLGHNPYALWVVADRLAQEEGSWSPFEPPASSRWLWPEGAEGAC